MMKKTKSPRNQTLTLSDDETKLYEERLISLNEPMSLNGIIDKTICQDINKALPNMPESVADVLVIDPPYNLRVKYGDLQTHVMKDDDYLDYIMSWLPDTLETSQARWKYLCVLRLEVFDSYLSGTSQVWCDYQEPYYVATGKG